LIKDLKILSESQFKDRLMKDLETARKQEYIAYIVNVKDTEDIHTFNNDERGPYVTAYVGGKAILVEPFKSGNENFLRMRTRNSCLKAKRESLIKMWSCFLFPKNSSMINTSSPWP